MIAELSLIPLLLGGGVPKGRGGREHDARAIS